MIEGRLLCAGTLCRPWRGVILNIIISINQCLESAGVRKGGNPQKSLLDGEMCSETLAGASHGARPLQSIPTFIPGRGAGARWLGLLAATPARVDQQKRGAI